MASRCFGGGPGVTRTPDTQFRKLLLCPPELRGRKGLRDARAPIYHFVTGYVPSQARRQTLEPLDAAAEMVRAQVCVSNGHLDVTVTEDVFQLVKVPAPHHVVAGKRVPQVVEPEPLEAGALHCCCERRSNLAPLAAVTPLEYQARALLRARFQRCRRVDRTLPERNPGARLEVVGRPAGMSGGKMMRARVLVLGEAVQHEAVWEAWRKMRVVRTRTA